MLTRLPPTVARAVAVTAVALVALSIGVAVASQWSRLPTFEWRFAPGWLALSLLAFAVLQVAHAELWRLILVNMGERLAVLSALAIWSVTLLGRYVPTGALMVVGRVAMAQREGVARPGPASTASLRPSTRSALMTFPPSSPPTRSAGSCR